MAKNKSKGKDSMEYGAGSGMGRLEKAGISTDSKKKKPKKNSGSPENWFLNEVRYQIVYMGTEL